MSEILPIIAGIAIVTYVIGRQLIGEPLRGKRVVLLPVILTVIGVADLGGKKHPVQPADVVCLIIGGLVVAAIGAAQGRAMRLESRNGSLWGQLPPKALWLWLLLIVSRVLMIGVADGVHAHVAASSATILLMLGINRLGQAAVVVPRALSAGIPFAPEKDGKVFMADLTSRRSAS
ncbi:MAG TPA: hypothetical protein VK662_05985 [Acidothermaceae bacterium]|nr:hypothetical protein [Acidothermaceae bacterium]